MTETKLRRLCKHWQKRLRLQDWKIDVGFSDDLDDGTLKGTAGITPKFLEAEIEIRDGMDDAETELTLVHELIHVRFPNHRYDSDVSLLGFEFEVGVEMVARTLVEAYDTSS